MTRHERIKAMSIEEMAEYFGTLSSICDLCVNEEYCSMVCNCQRDIKEYLEQEAEDEAE